MKNKIFFLVVFLIFLSANLNPQQNDMQILNEHWINQGYPEKIYSYFDYYSFFDDGTFVNNCGVYNSGTFFDNIIHGKYTKKNNIVELEVMEVEIRGYFFLNRQDKSKSFIIEIIEIDDNIVEIKYPNDEILIMNRYGIDEIYDK